MENDYLWDKTGEDKEIERLENALKSFRYQPTAPPILPAKVLKIEKKPKFSLFPKILRFAVAGTAGLAFGYFVTLGIWYQFFNKKIDNIGEYNQPLVQAANVEKQAQPANSNPNTKPKDAEPKIVYLVDKKPVQTRTATLIQNTKAVFQQPTRRIRQTKVIHLTKEEKYAYEQLILALSITGSKLKEVKDKANGVDETTATIKSLP